MRIILLGPPGAGKGTQAALLCKKYNIPHISTGEILRSAISDESELGKEAKGYMDKGALVPDKLMIKLIEERLTQDDCKDGFLLDGFPRTVDQAKALDALLAKIQAPLTHIIEIQVPDDILIERIKSRSEQGSGRSDDNEEVAANRLKVYWEQTAPVSKHYADKGILKQVDGLGAIEEVTERLLSQF